MRQVHGSSVKNNVFKKFKKIKSNFLKRKYKLKSFMCIMFYPYGFNAQAKSQFNKY